MSDPIRILVCDDYPTRASRNAETIRAAGGGKVVVAVAAPANSDGYDADSMQDLKLATDQLRKRTRFLVGDDFMDLPDDGDAMSPIIFDGFDVLVIDNNLERLWDTRPTAEEFLGQIRAFTECAYTIVLNAEPDRDFYFNLCGDVQSKADLGMNQKFLALPWLWGNRNADEKVCEEQSVFMPSYWREVCASVRHRNQQVQELEPNLSEPILQFFNLTDDGLKEQISREALSVLSGSDDTDPWSTTFFDFFRHSAVSLRFQDRERLADFYDWDSEAISEQYRERLAPCRNRIVARVVAAELSLWLQREILGPQQLLVDVPHLLQRMPFLLAGDKQDRKTWNQAANAMESPFGMDGGLYADEVARFRYMNGRGQVWLGKDTFLWPLIDASDKLTNLALADRTTLGFVFCEDTSSFEEVGRVATFVTGFHNIRDRRWFLKLKGVEYYPRASVARA